MSTSATRTDLLVSLQRGAHGLERTPKYGGLLVHRNARLDAAPSQGPDRDCAGRAQGLHLHCHRVLMFRASNGSGDAVARARRRCAFARSPSVINDAANSISALPPAIAIALSTIA